MNVKKRDVWTLFITAVIVGIMLGSFHRVNKESDGETQLLPMSCTFYGAGEISLDGLGHLTENAVETSWTAKGYLRIRFHTVHREDSFSPEYLFGGTTTACPGRSPAALLSEVKIINLVSSSGKNGDEKTVVRAIEVPVQPSFENQK